jgi:hypothetical protein
MAPEVKTELARWNLEFTPHPVDGDEVAYWNSGDNTNACGNAHCDHGLWPQSTSSWSDYPNDGAGYSGWGCTGGTNNCSQSGSGCGYGTSGSCYFSGTGVNIPNSEGPGSICGAANGKTYLYSGVALTHYTGWGEWNRTEGFMAEQCWNSNNSSIFVELKSCSSDGHAHYQGDSTGGHTCAPTSGTAQVCSPCQIYSWATVNGQYYGTAWGGSTAEYDMTIGGSGF